MLCAVHEADAWPSLDKDHGAFQREELARKIMSSTFTSDMIIKHCGNYAIVLGLVTDVLDGHQAHAAAVRESRRHPDVHSARQNTSPCQCTAVPRDSAVNGTRPNGTQLPRISGWRSRRAVEWRPVP